MCEAFPRGRRPGASCRAQDRQSAGAAAGGPSQALRPCRLGEPPRRAVPRRAPSSPPARAPRRPGAPDSLGRPGAARGPVVGVGARASRESPRLADRGPPSLRGGGSRGLYVISHLIEMSRSACVGAARVCSPRAPHSIVTACRRRTGPPPSEKVSRTQIESAHSSGSARPHLAVADGPRRLFRRLRRLRVLLGPT